jgi:hypothetical protein
VVVVVPDEVAVDEPGDRDGAELDEAKEEEQVKAGFLAVARGGSHGWEIAGLVWIEVGKLSPCCLVEMCFKLAMVWRFETQLVTASIDRLRIRQVIDLSFLLSFLKPGTCVRDTSHCDGQLAGSLRSGYITPWTSYFA